MATADLLPTRTRTIAALLVSAEFRLVFFLLILPSYLAKIISFCVRITNMTWQYGLKSGKMGTICRCFVGVVHQNRIFVFIMA